jgi:hypothetical protein
MWTEHSEGSWDRGRSSLSLGRGIDRPMVDGEQIDRSD